MLKRQRLLGGGLTCTICYPSQYKVLGIRASITLFFEILMYTVYVESRCMLCGVLGIQADFMKEKYPCSRNIYVVQQDTQSV